MEVNNNEVKNWGSKFFLEDDVQQQWRKRIATHKSGQEPQKNGSISPCIWEFKFFDLKFWRLFLLNSKIWKEGEQALGFMKKCLMGHTDGGRADNTQPPPNNTWEGTCASLLRAWGTLALSQRWIRQPDGCGFLSPTSEDSPICVRSLTSATSQNHLTSAWQTTLGRCAYALKPNPHSN